MTNNPGAGYFYSKKAQDKKKGKRKKKNLHTTLRTAASPGPAVTVMDGWCV